MAKGIDNQGNKTPAVEQQPAAQVPVDPKKEHEDALQVFKDKRRESEDRVEKMFSERSAATRAERTAALTRTNVDSLQEKQKQAIGEIYDKYYSLYKNQAGAHSGKREDLAKELAAQAENEVNIRLQNLEMVLRMQVQGSYITEEEAIKLRSTLSGIEQVSQNDTKVNAILMKMHNSSDLDRKDYDEVIDMLSPFDFTAKDAKSDEQYKATSVSMLVGLMNGKQRKKLVEYLMDSSKRDQVGILTDNYLRSGLLTPAQGEELFNLARDKGVITRTQYDTYKGSLEDGEYERDAEKFRTEMKKEVEQMGKMYHNNFFNRVSGFPMLGAVGLVHSFIWMLSNVLYAKGNIKELMDPKKSPYFWAALGEGALALEVTSGSFKIGSGSGIGSGMLTRGVQLLIENEGAKSDNEKRAFEMIGQVYLNDPTFGKFLEYGGAQAIWNIRKAKASRGLKDEQLAVTYDELRQTQTDPAQIGRLETAYKRPGMEKKMNGIAESMHILKMDTQQDFNDKLGYIKDSQGLTSETPVIASAIPARRGGADVQKMKVDS